MPKDLQDAHVGQLQFVSEPTPASGKYNRISIPYVENRHCLGYLEGPAASLVKKTRNDRKYPVQLWKNVEASEDFKEGMECAIIVGELDHPPERVDYSLSNGAVILTDWEIREDEGILWARFAILDTPEGRKIPAYAKFGTILGVSSRGLGDEIMLNGETCIDPETYEFYCFDVVAFPAVKLARQSFVAAEALTEGCNKSRDKFRDVVTEQLDKATTKEEIQTIKDVVESTNVSEKEALVEAITHKLSSLSESTDNQSSTGEEETSTPDEEKQVLLGSLAEKETALNASQKELAKTKELLKRRGESASYFRRVVQEQQEEINTLNAAVNDCLDSVKDVSTQLESANKDVASLKTQLTDTEKKLQESRHRARKQSDAATRKIRKLESEITKYRNDLKEARCKSTVESRLVESLKNDLNKSKNDAAILESKLAEETAQNVIALRESRSSLRTATEELEELKERNVNLQQQVAKLESESASAKTQLRESKAKRQESHQKTATLLNGYLRKCCEASGIDVDAVRANLPKSFTMKDIDKVVNEMADRQARFNMLPITLTPLHGRIVEHSSSQHQVEGNSFVVEALKRGQKTTN